MGRWARSDDPHAFLSFLLQRFPDFEARWPERGEGVGTEDLTFHRVCSKFSTHYIHDVVDFKAPEVAELFVLIEDVVAADPDDATRFANALCTCFLENISCTWAGEASVVLMGPASHRFFAPWHRPPPYGR